MLWRVRRVTRALGGLTGVVHAHVDLQRNQASVEHLPDQRDETSLIAAIEAAGDKARVEATSVESPTSQNRRRPDVPWGA